MKSNNVKNKLKEIGNIPKIKNGNKVYLIGNLKSIIYESSSKKELYQHKIKNPFPLLVSDTENLFIIKKRNDMKFDPKRGIIN